MSLPADDARAVQAMSIEAAVLGTSRARSALAAGTSPARPTLISWSSDGSMAEILAARHTDHMEYISDFPIDLVMTRYRSKSSIPMDASSSIRAERVGEPPFIGRFPWHLIA